MKAFLHNSVGKIYSGIVLCGLLFSITTHAQHLSLSTGTMRWEAGINVGPTFFLGDLGGNAGKGTRFLKDLNLELTKMMKGAFITVYPTEWLGFRVAGQLTYVEGKDNIISTNGEDELWRKQRNLDFRSNIWEAYAAFEYYPTLMKADQMEELPRWRPYGIIGIGVFHFDPEGSLTDNRGNTTWYKLHPLRTEGQGMKEYPEKKSYALTQINIPMGGGLRYQINDRFNSSIELLYRKTFTDYIDDVSTTYIDPRYFDQYLSPADARIARAIHDKTVGIVTPGVNRYEPGTQRGNSKQMDAYFSLVLKIGVALGDVYGDRPDKRALKKLRCPHFF
ncbi:MAG TPA: hypothetical protein PKK69_04820 [Ferruginibacter sp.]|nr:hypothetical protein [Ferruginibacter sp.]